jgi:hypothetical protein
MRGLLHRANLDGDEELRAGGVRACVMVEEIRWGDDEGFQVGALRFVGRRGCGVNTRWVADA